LQIWWPTQVIDQVWQEKISKVLPSDFGGKIAQLLEKGENTIVVQQGKSYGWGRKWLP